MSIFEDQDPFDEESSEGGRSGSKAFGIVAALAAIGIGLGVYVYMVGSDEPAPAAEPAPEVAEPEPESPRPEPRRRESADLPDGPRTGSLRIESNVSGASLFLDDEPTGALPTVLEDLKPRLYRIRVRADGYEDFVSSVTVNAGREAKLDVVLSRTPPSLRVTSDVAGATVFLDRNYVGVAPVTVPKLTPGQHQLTVSAEGFDMYAETIEVTDGLSEVNVEFRTAVVSESTPVIHKHRMGSCEGRLVADGQGLTYETSHKDRFSVTYGELEEFEVDYIEKNLKVKPRGQRNYNFTDPSGESDPLYVFHQKVSAFRQRIGQ